MKYLLIALLLVGCQDHCTPTYETRVWVEVVPSGPGYAPIWHYERLYHCSFARDEWRKDDR